MDLKPQQLLLVMEQLQPLKWRQDMVERAGSANVQKV
jgi:hypothetical protein